METNFINHDYINDLIKKNSIYSEQKITTILENIKLKKSLSLEEIAILLNISDKKHLSQLFNLAEQMKKNIYGDRIVVFAPLYLSSFCINNCIYCGYKKSNNFPRKKLTMQEIKDEVLALEKMGHKRLAIEIGEDPVNCDINYILEALKTIYETKNENGSIRRANINIAATTIENYKRLKEAGIGTYILFQETYHKPTYEVMHPDSLKSNYEYHLNSFSRCMEAGIDDVGAGVLFGLAPWQFEILALIEHSNYLEKNYGVGFHTISVPRLKKADGMELDKFPNLIDDDTFKKIVAILRVALPFTGLILSTRETPILKKEVIRYGVSQISAGSCTGVGGYKDGEQKESLQFSLSDNRNPLEVLKELLSDGYIPSYCTACYRSERTGDRFMSLAKSGNIQNVCLPNALMTLMEYTMDYGDNELKNMVFSIIEKQINNISNKDMKDLTKENIEKIKEGERDLFV